MFLVASLAANQIRNDIQQYLDLKKPKKVSEKFQLWWPSSAEEYYFGFELLESVGEQL